MINELRFSGILTKKEINFTKPKDKTQSAKEYIKFSLKQTELKTYNNTTKKVETIFEKFQVWDKNIIATLKNSSVGDEIEIVAKITSYENEGYINNNFPVTKLEIKKTNTTQSVEDEEIPF